MTKVLPGLTRRSVLKTTALGGVATLALPGYLRAQGAPIKVGILQPVTGALSYSGQQGRLGAEAAIQEINAAGGIKSMGGAKLEMVFGDARSTPDGGTQEVERMNGEGVVAVVGGFGSSICLAASQAAARYDIPYLVDVGVAETITARGLKNTFRFTAGLNQVVEKGIANLIALNESAGSPLKTVMIVHEDSLFGSGMAKALNDALPGKGYQILSTIPHPTPIRDFNNVVLQIRAQNPDIIIPSNYYNEYVLLARAMVQQRARPKAIYSILGGAASSPRFVKEFPDAANLVIDCNHWINAKNPRAEALKTKIESGGNFFTYEVFNNYSNVLLLADALERAGSADRGKLIEAIAASTFEGHIMPYGPTKFVNGQNQGAQPVVTQVQGGEIKVVRPEEFANAKAVFPFPPA